MKHQDLGDLDGPVLVFGGPYSNLHALEAVLAEATRRAIARGRMICTGDVVAYCAAPDATVARIQQSGVHVVAGNCEKQLAAGALDCGCGFEDGSACDILSAGWFAFANARIGPAPRAWMAGLPDIASFTQAGRRFAVIHGGATDIARFIWPGATEAVFDEEWEAIERAIGPVDGVIAGHCGLAFTQETRRGPWINAGVIGMPPHDGGTDTRYAVLEGAEVRFHRLPYNVTGAVAQMEGAGLIQGYHTALRSGYWPSEDILPEALRRPVSESG